MLMRGGCDPAHDEEMVYRKEHSSVAGQQEERQESVGLLHLKTLL